MLSTGKKILIVIGILILGFLIFIFYYTGILRISSFFLPQKPYQAVFLTNGQVYFGLLYGEGSQYPVLKDVYYLQVTQPLTQGQTLPQNLSLVKLGSELHGPVDEMKINRSQILFIETLRPDSSVVTSIREFKKTK